MSYHVIICMYERNATFITSLDCRMWYAIYLTWTLHYDYIASMLLAQSAKTRRGKGNATNTNLLQMLLQILGGKRAFSKALSISVNAEKKKNRYFFGSAEPLTLSDHRRMSLVSR